MKEEDFKILVEDIDKLIKAFGESKDLKFEDTRKFLNFAKIAAKADYKNHLVLP